MDTPDANHSKRTTSPLMGYLSHLKAHEQRPTRMVCEVKRPSLPMRPVLESNRRYKGKGYKVHVGSFRGGDG